MPDTPAPPPPSVVADEIRRQMELLKQDRLIRFSASALVYGMTLAFLPWQVAAGCAAVNFLGEIVILRLLQGLDPAQQRGRYWACLAWFFVVDAAFIIPASVIWHLTTGFAQSFSVGMVAAATLHLTNVRPIHLPIGLVGLAAIGTVLTISNVLHWQLSGDLNVLAMTLFSSALALGYSLSTMLNSNKLHRETVAGRAAAQAANAAKDRFLAQMSHELRTPLNAILGMGHAELDRATDPLSRERLQVLIVAAGGLNTLLEDLLDISAAEAGQLPLRPREVALRAEIGATLALFRPSIEAAGLQLHVVIADDVPERGDLDPQRLRQCLSNLLSNALRHTRQGAIAVEVGMGRAAAVPLLQITVSDTGPGVAAAQRDAIFAPFVRGDGAAETGTGRGLGLAISRTLARQMGGDLRLAPTGPGPASSPLGPDWRSGACFVLSLGLRAVDSPAPPVQARPDAGALKGRVILTVDDIATNRLVVMTYLANWGARGIETDSGWAALERLQSEAVDLVLLDLKMPGMDGRETLRRIRALPGAAGRVPVIALTADALAVQRGEMDGDGADGGGMDGYLAKPILPDLLLTALLRLLPRSTAAPRN